MSRRRRNAASNASKKDEKFSPHFRPWMNRILMVSQVCQCPSESRPKLALLPAAHASLRKNVLKAVYRLAKGDMAHSVSCQELIDELHLSLSPDQLWLIIVQLHEKKWIHYGEMHDDDRGKSRIGMSMQGIDEAEKMERGWLREFYEDHFAVASGIWTLVVLVLSIVANKTADVFINASKTPPPPIQNNVTVPEQKPPTIINNIILPEQKQQGK